jgi:hypothetical protein
MSASKLSTVASAAWLVDFLLRHGNDEELAFAEVLGVVAERGSILEYSAKNAIKPGLLLAWIRRDPARSRRYDQALLDRKVLDAEAVRGVWTGVIEQEPADLPTHTERLAAARDMGKHVGMLSERNTLVLEDRRDLSEAEIREQLRELLLRNPDVKRELLTLDIADAEVIEEITRATPPVQAEVPEAAPATPSAEQRSAERAERLIAASVFDEPSLAKPQRERAVSPI